MGRTHCPSRRHQKSARRHPPKDPGAASFTRAASQTQSSTHHRGGGELLRPQNSATRLTMLYARTPSRWHARSVSIPQPFRAGGGQISTDSTADTPRENVSNSRCERDCDLNGARSLLERGDRPSRQGRDISFDDAWIKRPCQPAGNPWRLGVGTCCHPENQRRRQDSAGAIECLAPRQPANDRLPP